MQDGDTLSDSLEPYKMTGVDLITFRLSLSPLPVDGSKNDVVQALALRRPSGEYATIHDTLLTLYHGVLIQSQDGMAGSCHWAGRERLLSTLVRVCQAIRFEIIEFEYFQCLILCITK